MNIDELKRALNDATNLAMTNVVKARIPECGDFGAKIIWFASSSLRDLGGVRSYCSRRSGVRVGYICWVYTR